jgi:methylmalonyl-CoA mutase C-terminal domain/subunit
MSHEPFPRARTRILLTKPTQDCHDRGVRYMAKRFRDEGFEVVFTNFLLASEVVAVAEQEDVDVIGVSSSSGGHLAVFEDLMGELGHDREVVVIAGGNIPPVDHPALRDLGVAAVFGPGSTPAAAVEFIRASVHGAEGGS